MGRPAHKLRTTPGVALALGKHGARRDRGNEHDREGGGVAGRLAECMTMIEFGKASEAESLRAFRDVVV
jgi:hypothetical protein